MLGKALSKKQSYQTVPAVAENTEWRGYFKPMQERGEHTHHQPALKASAISVMG